MALLGPDGKSALRTDKDICETCLFASMWDLTLSSLKAANYDVREDMVILVQRSIHRDLEKEGLAPKDVKRISRKIETNGHTILKACNTSLAQMVAGLARMTLKMRGEGWPITENVVLVAIAFNEEVKEDPSIYGGDVMIQRAAERMLNEAHRLEFFLMNKGFRPTEYIKDDREA